MARAAGSLSLRFWPMAGNWAVPCAGPALRTEPHSNRCAVQPTINSRWSNLPIEAIVLNGRDTTIMRKSVLLLAVLATPPATVSAHHSFAMFNRDQLGTVTGVVKDYEWANPHVWIHLMVADQNGTPREWGFEMQSIAQDTRAGWRPDSL